MSLPEIVSPEEWHAARTELLAEEKAMTKARDGAARQVRTRCPRDSSSTSMRATRRSRTSRAHPSPRSSSTRRSAVGYLLDETALGRQEDWELPLGRADAARGAVPNFLE